MLDYVLSKQLDHIINTFANKINNTKLLDGVIIVVDVHI